MKYKNSISTISFDGAPGFFDIYNEDLSIIYSELKKEWRDNLPKGIG